MCAWRFLIFIFVMMIVSSQIQLDVIFSKEPCLWININFVFIDSRPVTQQDTVGIQTKADKGFLTFFYNVSLNVQRF